MRPDIVNLRQFYSARLGRKVKARLRHVALAHWPTHSGDVILGIGYTLPILRVLERTGPGHVITLMPTAQGALYWPVHSENRSILGDEMRPPFAPNSISRIVMLHALEYARAPDELLRITWQLLAPGGQLLLIVPNRSGLWSRYGSTPFSSGTPYTLSALKTLLNDVDFTLREVSTALFAPPSAHPLWLKISRMIELVGKIFLPHSGGVLVIEAEKQIYAGVGERKIQKAKASAWSSVPA
jgi:SAM-dependent methyltransferase